MSRGRVCAGQFNKVKQHLYIVVYIIYCVPEIILNSLYIQLLTSIITLGGKYQYHPFYA